MALLIKQSHHHAFGPWRQGPGFDAHGQRAVQGKTSSAAVADHAEILGGRRVAVIQKRGVLDEQILSGLTATLPGALQRRGQHSLEGDSSLPEETIGGFEVGPVGEGLGQRSPRPGGEAGGDFHQTLMATRITQLGEGELGLGPLGRWQQRCAHSTGR